MTTTSIVVTGRGGQGGKLAGELLARSASTSGLIPTLYSVYSALIRGGDIASFLAVDKVDPGVAQRGSYDVMLALHNNWFDRYFPQIRPGGVLLYDGRFVSDRLTKRTDIAIVDLPLRELSQQAGDPRSSSMVAAGAVAAVTGIAALAAVEEGVRSVVPPHRSDRIAGNLIAVGAGFEWALREGLQPAGTGPSAEVLR